MTESSPIVGLERALESTGEVIAGIRDDQWVNPTPCPNWDVRTLLNHLVGGNVLFASILSGAEPPSPEALQKMRGLDQLGDNPVTAYRQSAAKLLEAFRRPGVLEGTYQVPAGTVPGIAALHLRITETLMHGWDLAQATHQSASSPDDLAEHELAFSQQRAAGMSRTGHPFGPEQPVPSDAPAIDRLAAFLGRPVTSA